MFLKEYITKIKNNTVLLDKKDWINRFDLFDHIKQDMPSSRIEEWKNFKTNYLKKTNWQLFNAQLKSSLDVSDGVKAFSNSIIFEDGKFNPTLSSYKSDQGIKVSNIKDYIESNPHIKSKLYSDSEKYAENRLSGVVDKTPAYFISLNSILSSGTVIEIQEKKKIEGLINIIHIFSNAENENLVNPYIAIISKKGSQSNIQEIFYDIDCWVNNVTEVFLENESKLVFSRLQSKVHKGIKTSSFNCHLENSAEIELKVLNRENCKEDIRVFLNEDNSKATISGMIFSCKNHQSDVFCKTVHKGKNTFSDQKWRLISAEKSKTSINGKICVNRNAKGSDASFYSKSLNLDENSNSFSKPELEILEDDVKCKHGASFGEIDKNIIFYMQSRGIKREDAIMMLVYAFIEEIGLGVNEGERQGIKLVDEIFKGLKGNE